MRSLDAQPHDPEQRGWLPHHPDCPGCGRAHRTRDSWKGLVSRRTQAALAAALLVFPAATPAAALATSDQEAEGGVAVGQRGGSDTASSADLVAPDPVLTGQGEPSPAAGPNTAVESGQAPVAGAAAPGAEQPATSPPPGQPDAPDSQQPAAPASPAATPDASPGPTAAPDNHGDRSHAPASRRRTSATPEPRQAPVTSSFGGELAAPAVEPTYARRAPLPVATSGARRSGDARPGDRAHTVTAGESLWSIASDLLGDRASQAVIAREVNRLWELNKEQIATGDPDLLMIGAHLRLR